MERRFPVEIGECGKETCTEEQRKREVEQAHAKMSTTEKGIPQPGLGCSPPLIGKLHKTCGKLAILNTVEYMSMGYELKLRHS